MSSNALIAAAGMLLVAALTPGPNNLAVLRVAASGGASAAWPAIGGVVLGGLAMLGLTVAGFAWTYAQWPFLSTAVAAGGAIYLGWLGFGLLRARTGEVDAPALPAGGWGLFGFQFLNPKSWVMVLSIVAAFPQAGMHETFAYLAPAFLLIPTACLWLWAMAGLRLAPHLRDPAILGWVDRAMGIALIASALLLLI